MKHPFSPVSATPLRHAWLFACCLAILLCAGCASGSTARTTPTPSPSPTSAAIAPSGAATSTAALPTSCADLTPPALTPAPTVGIPLPPGTVSIALPSASGAGFWKECTPNATATQITSFLNTALPHAGWRAWNPQTDDSHGCGTQANTYWQWTKGKGAVGWTVAATALPFWSLAFCDLSWGA